MRVVKFAIFLSSELACELCIGEGDEVCVRAWPSRTDMDLQAEQRGNHRGTARLEGRALVDFKFEREDASRR